MIRRIAWSGTLRAAALGAALLLCAATARAAAPAVAGVADNQPIQIQADSGIEWDQNAHLYIARGNAVAIRGDSEVHADTLIAYYRPTKGAGNTGDNTEIYRVEAEGHVRLVRGAQTVVGDHAVYDVDQAIAVVTGKGLKLTTATDTVTARDSLEWYDQKQIAVARGDAVATRNGKTIRADILTAYMHKTAPSQAKGGGQGAPPGRAAPTAITPASAKTAPGAAESKISRVDAQGHVVISDALDTGRGDFGVYNAETGIATLIGDVVIERGKDVIRGQRGVMDLNRNISRMLPGSGPGATHQRVQGLFIREEKAGHATSGGAAAGGHPVSAGGRP